MNERIICFVKSSLCAPSLFGSTFLIWQVPADHNLLRQIKSLCTQLPALDTKEFRDEFVQV